MLITKITLVLSIIAALLGTGIICLMAHHRRLMRRLMDDRRQVKKREYNFKLMAAAFAAMTRTLVFSVTIHNKAVNDVWKRIKRLETIPSEKHGDLIRMADVVRIITEMQNPHITPLNISTAKKDN